MLLQYPDLFRFFRAAAFFAAFAASTSSGPALACGGWADVGCNVGKAVEKGAHDAGHAGEKTLHDVGKTLGKAGQDTGKTLEKTAHDIGHTLEKAAQDTGKTVEKAAHDAGRTTEIAAHDTGHAIEKASRDIGKTYEKAGQDTWRASRKAVSDLGEAGGALSRFVVREVKGLGKSFSDLDRRLKEGKIVDAIWEFEIDPIRNTEHNAAAAAQESVILATVGQVAASAYGGPAGAAAYAAWLTYRRTGNADLALRAGIITGITSEAFTAVGHMPSITNTQIAEKTVAAGAVGGLAVAAMGGDHRAVRDSVLLAAGMVLVQTGYERRTGHPIEGKASEGEAYCKSTLNAYCSAADSYVTDENGNVVLDEYGNPKTNVNMRALDPRRPHVGTWSTEDDTGWIGTGERTQFMTGVSRVPGMNAMAYLHDIFVDDEGLSPLLSKATIIPATLLTYLGTGAPYFNRLMEIGIANRPVNLPVVLVKPAVHRPQGLIATPVANGNLEVVQGVFINSPEIQTPLVVEVVPMLSESTH
ncbi:hypothetical protein LB553_21185 [Mesorhizobium sp. CA8]|uniref:hypothetical protein n=1 Tax=Mesorhizobium sp. CA8 TaxID=2876637 RepID=UPI001CCE00CF|nr:hypothetical protein [Mesorhizobium sp. CA8]MBZ9763377.1 hypothetical protein [Mesorhizobium sp. CA8]